MSTTPVTRLDLFTVPPRAVAHAVTRMATDRRRLRRSAPIFWKLMGTGDGRTYDVRDADLRRWAVLTVWATTAHAAAFGEAAQVVAGWRTLADEHWWALLRPLRVSGCWSRRQPFGAPDHQRTDGPVAALTRARLRWSRARRFWRSIPPVTAELARADGLRLRVGIGEAPLGLQGTFSVWDSPAAMQAFAYRGAAHRDVIRRSTDERWYAEELFARFAVTAHDGTVFGTDPLRR
jgi:heme-degrading monooxygenase HmoA